MNFLLIYFKSFLKSKWFFFLILLLLLDFFFFKDQNIVDMVIFNLISSGFKKKFRVKMFKFLFYEGQIKK